MWKKAIINHLYYVAAEAGDDDQRRERGEAMWISISNHIQDIHEHEHELFQMCDHPHLPEDGRKRKWLKAGRYYACAHTHTHFNANQSF